MLGVDDLNDLSFNQTAHVSSCEGGSSMPSGQAKSGGMFSTRSVGGAVLQPELQGVLTALDVRLEDELRRYRQQKRVRQALANPKNPQRGAPSLEILGLKRSQALELAPGASVPAPVSAVINPAFSGTTIAPGFKAGIGVRPYHPSQVHLPGASGSTPGQAVPGATGLGAWGQNHPSQGQGMQDPGVHGDPAHGAISQGYPPQGYPAQGHPAQGHPAQGYPAQGYPAQGYPAQGYPAQGHPAQGYPPQGHPPQGYVPQDQGYPAQGHPAQGYISEDQGYGTQGYAAQGYDNRHLDNRHLDNRHLDNAHPAQTHGGYGHPATGTVGHPVLGNYRGGTIAPEAPPIAPPAPDSQPLGPGDGWYDRPYDRQTHGQTLEQLTPYGPLMAEDLEPGMGAEGLEVFPALQQGQGLRRTAAWEEDARAFEAQAGWGHEGNREQLTEAVPGISQGSHPAIVPQGTAPQIPAPQVTTPQVTAPQITPPPVIAPQVTAPQVTAPQVTAPQVTPSQTPGMASPAAPSSSQAAIVSPVPATHPDLGGGTAQEVIDEDPQKTQAYMEQLFQEAFSFSVFDDHFLDQQASATKLDLATTAPVTTAPPSPPLALNPSPAIVPHPSPSPGNPSLPPAALNLSEADLERIVALDLATEGEAEEAYYLEEPVGSEPTVEFHGDSGQGSQGSSLGRSISNSPNTHSPHPGHPDPDPDPALTSPDLSQGSPMAGDMAYDPSLALARLEELAEGNPIPVPASQPLNLAATLPPDDYLASSEALLEDLPDGDLPEETKPLPRWLEGLFSPLGIGSLLLLLMSSTTLGYVILNPSAMDKWGLDRLWVHTSPAPAPNGSAEPETPTKPAGPDLATQEFVDLNLDNLSTAKPTTLPAPVASPLVPGVTPSPSPTGLLSNLKAAVAPASPGVTPSRGTTAGGSTPDRPPTFEASPPDNGSGATYASPEENSYDPGAESSYTEDSYGDAPAPSVEPEPPRAYSPPAPPPPQAPRQSAAPPPPAIAPANSSQFSVVTPYTSDQLLDQSQQAVPDAYLRNSDTGAQIQFGAFSDRDRAEELIQELQQQGIPAQLQEQ